MTELERLQVENAQLRALLIDTDRAVGILIDAMTQAIGVMSDAGNALREIAPSVAAAANLAVENWSTFVRGVIAARTAAGQPNNTRQ